MNRTLAAILLFAAVLAAVPADAQRGRGRGPFRSDVRGPDITGSGVARYPSVPIRDLEGALFREVDGQTAFRSRAVADAILGEAGEAERAACAGTLQPPKSWPDSLNLDPNAQRVVCGLLARPGMDRDEARRVLRALRGGGPGQPGDAAEVLVAALAGLSADQPGFVDGRQRHVDGARWETAIRAYDVFLAGTPDSLMDSPPGELVAIAVLLDRVVDAGLLAGEQ
jgi:hypothetical protein